MSGIRHRLADLASIKPGYAFRRRIAHDPGGRYRILQPSDLGPAGEVDEAALPRVGHIQPKDYHRVHGGVVLFTAYGTRNRAYLLATLPTETVASSTFYLITPAEAALLPGYLKWYLNQPPAQAYFEALRSGISVQVLRRDALGSLEVPVPPLAVQQRMAEVIRLADEEMLLARQLIQKRRLLTDALLLNHVQSA